MVIVNQETDPSHCSQPNNDNDDIHNMLSDDEDNNNMSVPFGGSMAAAFQAACDEDVRQTLNALSKPSDHMDSLHFYMIPCSWMESCRSYLIGQQSQERPQLQISNSTLLALEHKISSSSEDEQEAEESRKRRLRQAKWRERQRRNRSMKKILRNNLSHKQDYYLVGPSVWCLLSSKFGYDLELERNLVLSGKKRLAVNVGTSLIVVPLSGRFDVGIYKNVERDVVSEEDDEMNDLFPSVDNNDDTVPPLLLPPSTTATNSLDSPNKMLYSAKDMDYDEQEVVKPEKKLYASGLGNLGNTCFMNSTLQCLAHTDPLRRYFLSGDYLEDLNRDNPLGTGGELATEFAELLKEMWGYKQTSSTYYSSTYAAAVYPRSFKGTLGRHAAQFLGYDQHDSHELATYLLDALHEDTNRVTKKPYVEKPEQGQDESDDVAARKAWRAHLQREDSRVLEQFMGLVKSRVQCPTEGCGRVSTTFDPFMYLSVPIPGASDRTLTVTYFPLEPRERCKTLRITLNKASSMAALKKKIVELVGVEGVENVCLADVWSHEVYTYYGPQDEIDKIRDTDTTFCFELLKVSSIQKEEEENNDNDDDDSLDGLLDKKFDCHTRGELDEDTLSKFQKGKADWMQILEKYVRQPTMLYALFSPTRGKMEERLLFLRKLQSFLDLCHSCQDVDMFLDDDDAPTLEERCETSTVFCNVRDLSDLGILECCHQKFQEYLLDIKKQQKEKYKDGITLQVVFQRKPRATTHYHASAGDRTFTTPMTLRIPPTMTVYGLREEIGKRLSRSLKTGRPSVEKMDVSSPEDTKSSVVPVDTEAENDAAAVMTDDMDLGSPELLILRQVPLTYSKKSEFSTYKASSSYGSNNKLGMLECAGINEAYDGRPISLASPSDEEEKKVVSQVLGDGGTVYLHWPTELSEQYLDVDEYEACDEWKTLEPEQDGIQTRKAAKKITTVSDCIERYCQMEQLEESEMWYCNRCKDHVRAWKQFHLYRTPPILIIHLKRFQYSATTHRRDKIDCFIDFPLTGLDLTNEVMQWTEEEKPIYDLYAVSNHFGGLGGGHYTAYALGDDGKWCNFDDSRVTSDVDPKEVKSSAAYVLYYRRRDVVLDGVDIPRPAIVQDNGEDMTTSEDLTSAATSQAHMEVDSNDADPRFYDEHCDVFPSNVSTNTCASPMGSDEELDDHYGNGTLASDPDDDGPYYTGYTSNDVFPAQ